ncbi:MAG: DUF4343 domain-containing protein [Aquabacterium sp.]|nr:MAG: DUF4343 domain-containing protein [Aquabacterium sp.]
MFWILQRNFFNAQAFERLQDELQARGTPHAVVDLRMRERLPLAIETVPELDIDGPVFVLGSSSLGQAARRKGWTPGYFDQGLDYRELLQHYGDRMLNADAVVAPLDQAYWWRTRERLFVRPADDRKAFTGQVMHREDFESWRERVLALQRSGAWQALGGDDLVVLASPKDIHAEYRFHVVAQRVVTGSQYRLGRQSCLDARVDPRVRDYAQSCVDTWSPNPAFCLDIADTPQGLKVLEINAINSSGFHASDLGRLVRAIDALDPEHESRERHETEGSTP